MSSSRKILEEFLLSFVEVMRPIENMFGWKNLVERREVYGGCVINNE